MSEERWQKRLLWLVIGAMVTVAVTTILTPLIDNIKSGITNLHTSSGNPPSSDKATILPSLSPSPTAPLVQLKHSYNGTLVGGAHSPMDISFTVTSQDQEGNITGTVSVSGDDYFIGTGSCEGTLNHKRHIHLKCSDYFRGTDPELDTYEGDVLPDGSIKGRATLEGDLGYNWNMS